MRLRLVAGAFAGAAAGVLAGAFVSPMLPWERLSLSGAVAFRVFAFVWGSFALFGGAVGTAVAYLTRRIRPSDL